MIGDVGDVTVSELTGRVTVRVLVVDDNVQLSRSVTLMLEDGGHHVDSTADPRVAIDMVGEGNYDFVLVDYKMPVNDGVWFMKNVEIPKGTKVLLMTGFVNRSVINEIFELGAVGYIVKPFDHTELMKHLGFHSSRD